MGALLLADPAGNRVGRTAEARDAVLAVDVHHRNDVVIVLFVFEPVLLDHGHGQQTDRTHNGDMAVAPVGADQHIADLRRDAPAVGIALETVERSLAVPVLGMALPQICEVVEREVVAIRVLHALPLDACELVSEVGRALAVRLEVRAIVLRVVVRVAVHAVERAGVGAERKR